MSVFSLFVVRKEVQKQDAEEKIKSTGKKEYSETQIWKETVSYDCVSCIKMLYAVI